MIPILAILILVVADLRVPAGATGATGATTTTATESPNVLNLIDVVAIQKCNRCQHVILNLRCLSQMIGVRIAVATSLDDLNSAPKP
jgi:hypothetical protein